MDAGDRKFFDGEAGDLDAGSPRMAALCAGGGRHGRTSPVSGRTRIH